jgi:DNA-binding NarL/FixJ family response regulator
MSHLERDELAAGAPAAVTGTACVRLQSVDDERSLVENDDGGHTLRVGRQGDARGSRGGVSARVESPAGVMVVDDHALVRSGVRSFLEADGRFRVAAEAGSVAEVRARLETLPDTVSFVVVDIELRDGSGIDVIREARLRQPPLEVVVLTAFPDARTLHRALATGARGFVLKEAGGGALVTALACARDGQLYLDPRLGDAIVTVVVIPDDIARQASDQRLLSLLAEGLTDKDIAGVLGRTPSRAHRDISALLQRMGVASRAAAVSQAVRSGILV